MNPQFDALIERFHVTVPMQERIQVLGDLIYHIADQLPQLPLFYDAEPVLINHRIVGAGGKTPRSTQAWNAHEWSTR